MVGVQLGEDVGETHVKYVKKETGQLGKERKKGKEEETGKGKEKENGGKKERSAKKS